MTTTPHDPHQTYRRHAEDAHRAWREIGAQSATDEWSALFQGDPDDAIDAFAWIVRATTDPDAESLTFIFAPRVGVAFAPDAAGPRPYALDDPEAFVDQYFAAGGSHARVA